MSKVIIVQVGWTAESNKPWITADGGTEDRPGTTLNISENESTSERSGKVTYTQVESGNRVVVNVNQEGKEEPPVPKYRYYGFKVRRDDPVVDEMLNSGCQPEFTWRNRNGSNRTAEAIMIKDDEYAYWVICTENEDDFPDSGGVHYQYCVAYLSAGTNSISFEKNGGKITIPVSACSIDTEFTISTNDYWSGNEIDTSKTEDETVNLSLDFGYDFISGYDNVTVTETQGEFKWSGGSSSGSVLVEAGENNTGQNVTDTLRLINGGREGECCKGRFDIAFTQASGSSESTKWYWAFRITKPSTVTATSVPHVVVENESGVEVFNEDWVSIGERIQVGKKTLTPGAPTPSPYTITIDGFEESVINTSESSVTFENGVSAITLNDSTTPPTFTVGRKNYTPETVKTITVSADCKMIGNTSGGIQPSTDPNAATDVPLKVDALCDEWKAEVTNANATSPDWLSISKNGNNLVLNFSRENDQDNVRQWDDKSIRITCSCNSVVNFNAEKHVRVERERIPYDGDFFVSGRSDFYIENILRPEEDYAEKRQRYLFTPSLTMTTPFGFISGTSTATTLIPAVTYRDDLKIWPYVVFSDASTPMTDYDYENKYDKLHLYDVVYYENGVLYHSIETLTGSTITNKPGIDWSALNASVGSNGTGLTFTVSTGNGTVNMVMGGFSNSHSISTDIFNSGGGGASIRTGLISPSNSANCFNVNYEIGSVAYGLWPLWFVPIFLRTSDYDVVINDPYFSSDGTGIVEIVTIDGVEYYLIHDYSKVTITLKDNNGEG